MFGRRNDTKIKVYKATILSIKLHTSEPHVYCQMLPPVLHPIFKVNFIMNSKVFKYAFTFWYSNTPEKNIHISDERLLTSKDHSVLKIGPASAIEGCHRREICQKWPLNLVVSTCALQDFPGNCPHWINLQSVQEVIVYVTAMNYESVNQSRTKIEW